MANEITFGWVTGKSLDAAVYSPAGVRREDPDVDLTEIGTTGLYIGSSSNIVTGDLVIIDNGIIQVGWGQYNPAGILSSDGLDTISTTEPAGVASNFREMMVAIFRRAYKKVTMNNTSLNTYKDDDSVGTSQTVSDDGTTQIVGNAS